MSQIEDANVREAKRRAGKDVDDIFYEGIVEMKTVRTGDVAITEASIGSKLTGKAQAFYGIGSSKRASGDPRDVVIGGRLAAGRALLELGFRLIDDAEERIKKADDEAARTLASSKSNTIKVTVHADTTSFMEALKEAGAAVRKAFTELPSIPIQETKE